jgi:hypothetical protein
MATIIINRTGQKFLNIVGIRMSSEGCRHLASAKWPNLQKIYLGFSEFT